MYILKGYLKRKKIFSPSSIRAASLRVKKACFDILNDQLKDKRILDLFAGSGALGIEALSEGAKEAVFVDISKFSINAIRKNLKVLSLLDRAKVYEACAFHMIKVFFNHRDRFDIIFLDPPYYKRIFIKTLKFLEVYDILNLFGYIIGFCYIKDEYINESKRFSLILKRSYGQTLLLIYKKINE